MAVITRSSFAKFLVGGFVTAFGLKYAEYPNEFLKIYEKNTSTRGFEEEMGVSTMGMFQKKTEIGGIAYDEMSQTNLYRYIFATYALGFMISKECYEDGDAVVKGLKNTKALAFSARQTMETLAATILNLAFDNTYKFVDGMALCDTDRPLGKFGGTWANTPAGASDFCEEALEQALIDIGNFVNDRGMKIAVQERALLLPHGLKYDAIRTLKSDQQSGTNYNDTNALKEDGAFPGGIIYSHFLTDPDSWFILTNCPDGMKYYERTPLNFDSTNDWETNVAKFKAEFRAGWGCTDPRGIYGVQGA